jgi:hypothetical protein
MSLAAITPSQHITIANEPSCHYTMRANKKKKEKDGATVKIQQACPVLVH